jgi:hypothetical protein
MRNIKCKDVLCLLLVALLVMAIYKMVTPSPPPPPPIAENWFGSDAWDWTKKTAKNVGKTIGHAAESTGEWVGDAGKTVGKGIGSAATTVYDDVLTPVGKGIGSAATTVYDDVLTPVGHFVEYESTRPFGASTATYFGRGHSGQNDDHGFYYDWVKTFSETGGGLAGLVGLVTGLVPAIAPVADDAAAGALSILGKPIRLIADKDYRDHFWDGGSWGDNNWDHTLHPGGR